jgi:cell division protein FtsI/penicillin-binding protein 2
MYCFLLSFIMIIVCSLGVVVVTRGGVSMVAVRYGAHQPLPCDRGGRCDWQQMLGGLEAATTRLKIKLEACWSSRLEGQQGRRLMGRTTNRGQFLFFKKKIY